MREGGLERERCSYAMRSTLPPRVHPGLRCVASLSDGPPPPLASEVGVGRFVREGGACGRLPAMPGKLFAEREGVGWGGSIAG